MFLLLSRCLCALQNASTFECPKIETFSKKCLNPAHTSRLINVVPNVFVAVTSIWNFDTAVAVVGYGSFCGLFASKHWGQSINLTCFMWPEIDAYEFLSTHNSSIEFFLFIPFSLSLSLSFFLYIKMSWFVSLLVFVLFALRRWCLFLLHNRIC